MSQQPLLHHLSVMERTQLAALIAYIFCKNRFTFKYYELLERDGWTCERTKEILLGSFPLCNITFVFRRSDNVPIHIHRHPDICAQLAEIADYNLDKVGKINSRDYSLKSFVQDFLIPNRTKLLAYANDYLRRLPMRTLLATWADGRIGKRRRQKDTTKSSEHQLFSKLPRAALLIILKQTTAKNVIYKRSLRLLRAKPEATASHELV